MMRIVPKRRTTFMVAGRVAGAFSSDPVPDTNSRRGFHFFRGAQMRSTSLQCIISLIINYIDKNEEELTYHSTDAIQKKSRKDWT